MVGECLTDRANQRGSVINEPGIELHQAGARTSFGEGVITGTDATDPDQRDLTGQSFIQGGQDGGRFFKDGPSRQATGFSGVRIAHDGRAF